MNAQERLIKWHFLWQVSKDVVTCRSCGAWQLEKDQELSFEHHNRCVNSREVRHPWDELDRICRGL